MILGVNLMKQQEWAKNIKHGEVKKVANQIKKYREAAGMTQVELAEKLKISSVSLCRYETGERVPRWQEIKTMCQLFTRENINCTPEMLMDENPTQPPVG